MRNRLRPLTAALAVVALLLLAGCGETTTDSTQGEPSATPSPTATETESEAPSEEPTAAECEYTEDGAPPAREVEPPSGEPATGKPSATIKTNQGAVTIDFDTELAPCTVANFLSLAEQGYYDGTVCHRLTTQGIFVLQCGDPTGTGAGGPGYAFADEVGQLERELECQGGACLYPPGSVAMANAGPNTNGSQFFLVYDPSPLPPAYTVFGTMRAEGLKVVEDIAKAGTATGGSDGAPKKPVEVSAVTVS